MPNSVENREIKNASRKEQMTARVEEIDLRSKNAQLKKILSLKNIGCDFFNIIQETSV